MGIYVVTGGTKGIGEQTVAILRSKGHEVINVDVDGGPGGKVGSYDDVVNRKIGTFQGDSSYPTHTEVHNNVTADFQDVICCTGNCMQALYYAWEAIVTEDTPGSGLVTVNLLLNRATKWLDVYSYLPYEGRVDLLIKNPKDNSKWVVPSAVAVRIPVWLQPYAGEIKVNNLTSGKSIEFSIVGDCVLLTDYSAGDRISLVFPAASMEPRVETYTYTWKNNEMWSEWNGMYDGWKPGKDKITITFIGNTAIFVEADAKIHKGVLEEGGTNEYGHYQYNCRGDRGTAVMEKLGNTPLKSATWYVPDNTIMW